MPAGPCRMVQEERRRRELDALKRAQAIKDRQTAEIKTMESMLAKL